MALASRQRGWSFAVQDRDHSVKAEIVNRGLTITLTIWIDGEVQIQEKGSDLEELWREYPLRFEHCSGTLRAFRKGFLGVATDFELRVEGQVIPTGERPTIAICEPESQTPESPALDPQPTSVSGRETVVPTIPVLPASCSACGASLAMDEVRWSGPLAAQCPYCGTRVDIEWRKIG
jgi:hypothetical protein